MKAPLHSVILTLCSATTAKTAGPDHSCRGQATAVFAGMGTIGEHANKQDEPRLGLRNLARAASGMGVIPDDSIALAECFLWRTTLAWE